MELKSKNEIDKLSEALKNLGNTVKISNREFADFLLTLSSGIETFKSIKSLFNFDKESGKFIEKIKNMCTEVKNRIDSAFQAVDKAFSNLSNTLKSKGIGGILDDMGKKVKEFGKSVRKSLSDAKGNFKDFFSNIKERGSESFNSLKKNISGAFTSLKNDPFGKLSKAVTAFGALAAGVFAVGVVGGIVLAVAAIAGFIAYFKQLMDTNEEFREKITTMWEGVKEAFQPAIDAFGELLACLVTNKEAVNEESGEIADSFLSVAGSIIEGITGIVTFFSDIVIGIIDFIKEILFTTSEDAVGQNQTTWEKITQAVSDAWILIEDIFSIAAGIITELWDLFGEDIIGIFSTVWDLISGVISGAVDVVKGILDVIVGIFTGNGEKIKEGFGKIWKGIKGIFSGIGEFFSGIWDKVVSIFKKVGTKIGDAISGAFKTVVNGILEFAEKVINGFIKAINFAIKMINLIPGVDIQPLELLVIPKLASGGLMEPGQMFIAREAGPELVGSFGSKTAVMNNNQIVESVSRGVYDAVRNAMGSGKGNYTFNITNTLDGREIGKQVIKYHNGVVKQTGVSPLLI